MSDIYNLEFKDDVYKIPSKEYVDARIKVLLEMAEAQKRVLEENKSIYSGSVELKPFTDIEEEKELNLNDTKFQVQCTSKDVETTPDRKFVSDELLNSFRSKPSLQEVNELISNAKKELSNKIDELFVNVLNSNDATQLLNTLSNLLKEDDKFNAFISSLSHKIDDEEFDDHVDSSLHVSKEDRDALNYLHYVCDHGIDWNSTDECITIINKPESMKANGGNADTLGGYSIDNIKEWVNGCVINLSGSTDFDIDIYKNGKYSILDGEYNLNNISFKNNSSKQKMISGNGDYTQFISDSDYSKVELSNITIRDLKFNNYKDVIIYDKVNLNNVYFKNCSIILNGCHLSIIKNCTFENCKITTFRIGSCIMTDNFFIRTPEISHRAQNFVYRDNIKA